jgi:hypothetical protein
MSELIPVIAALMVGGFAWLLIDIDQCLRKIQRTLEKPASLPRPSDVREEKHV